MLAHFAFAPATVVAKTQHLVSQLEEPVNEVAADEAGAAGDENACDRIFFRHVKDQ